MGHIVSPLPPFPLLSLAALVLPLVLSLALHMHLPSLSCACPPFSLLCTRPPSRAPAFPLVLMHLSSLSFQCAHPVSGGAVAAAPTAVIDGAVAAAATVHVCSLSCMLWTHPYRTHETLISSHLTYATNTDYNSLRMTKCWQIADWCCIRDGTKCCRLL